MLVRLIEIAYEAGLTSARRAHRSGCSVIVAGVLLGVLTFSGAEVGADTVYECSPSGFSLGLAPVRGPSDIYSGVDLRRSLPYQGMQELLAKQMYESKLFSNIATYTDGPHPDSTDLSLMVTIPSFQRFGDDVYPSIEISVRTMLIENMGGTVLASNMYSTEFKPSQSTGFPTRERVTAEIMVEFLKIIPRIIEDLDRELQLNTSPSYRELEERKLVRHESLEPLWVLPPFVSEGSPGMANYRHFIGNKLQERLQRKDCFTFPEMPDSLRPCLSLEEPPQQTRVLELRSECPQAQMMEGMLLMTYLSSDAAGFQVRSILVHFPSLSILYDRTLAATSGWRMGNAVEAHAAGIAQASHTIP